VQTDARNAATAEEAYFVDNNAYTATCDSLPGFTKSDGVTVVCELVGTTGFKITTSHGSMAYTTGCTWLSDPGAGNPNMTCS
jgi:hypothetical protein